MNNQEIAKESLHLAKYKAGTAGITKDGHTMFLDDVVNDLNRKSFLELSRLELIREIEELKRENKTQQSYIDNALDNSKEELISRIAELEKRTECTVESFNLEAHNLDQQAAALNEYAYSGKPLTKRGLNIESIALSDKAKELGND